MKAEMHFDSIGNSITTRVALSELSGRDKVNILQYLMEDLGITCRIEIFGPELTYALFQRIWSEQTNKAWNEK